METAQIIWAALVIAFLALEAATAGLTSIWLAFGAIVALVISLVNPDTLLIQTIAFGVVSAATYYLLRCTLIRFVNKKAVPTNADRVIGKAAYVSEPIDNMRGTGEVTVDGRVWLARSMGDSPISLGATVLVQRISGAKLLVSNSSDA